VRGLGRGRLAALGRRGRGQLGGGRAAPQQAGTPSAAASEAAAAEEAKPKIALKMDFSAFGGGAPKPAAA
jgi:hypothetical protein